MLNTAQSEQETASLLDNLQAYVEQQIEKHGIPALSLAVWKDGKLYQATSGILNLDTGVEATADSIFQIGSITKVFTVSLMMKLVDEGRVDLDKPVKHYLRDFQIGDAKAAEIITVKQLLNHSSGIYGDYEFDDSKEEGAHIARYVDRCSQSPLVHPVGEGFSYSNAALVVAGRVIEVVSGISWADAMEEWIYKPLGMNHAICRPADVIRFRAAIGHITDSEAPEKFVVHPGPYITLGIAPAGSVATMRIADLITFGRAHLEGGLNTQGERWLSEASIRAMQTPTIDVPSTSQDASGSMGLGWGLAEYKASGLRSVSHNGGTNGQCSLLRLFPEHNACFAILVNCRGQGEKAIEEIGNDLTLAITGVDLKASASKPEPVTLTEEQLQPYLGRFKGTHMSFNFVISQGQLVCRDDDEAQTEYAVIPVGDDCVDFKLSEEKSLGILRFMNFDTKDGRAMALYCMGRQILRVGE